MQYRLPGSVYEDLMCLFPLSESLEISLCLEEALSEFSGIVGMKPPRVRPNMGYARLDDGTASVGRSDNIPRRATSP